MTRSTLRKHLPPWLMGRGARPKTEWQRPGCNHRHGWETIDLNGRLQDICKKCGTVRQVRA